VGKTRLALEVAVRTGGSYRDGVCFCDLAAVSEPHSVVRALATAAGLSERAFQRLDDQLVEQLAGRHLLLVLDNCEHVAQAAAILAERLLKETRQVTMLATSRERLEVNGEHVWQVRPTRRHHRRARPLRAGHPRMAASRRLDPDVGHHPDAR
jgi:non-specific serine/threonine protein kinase